MPQARARMHLPTSRGRHGALPPRTAGSRWRVLVFVAGVALVWAGWTAERCRAGLSKPQHIDVQARPRPEPPEDPRAALALARREAARVAREPVLGESDLSAVLVACDHDRHRACRVAAFAAAHVLQNAALHRFHILRTGGQPLVPEDEEGTHHLRRERFEEKMWTNPGSLSWLHQSSAGQGPYAIFIAIVGAGVQLPTSNGWFNIAIVPPGNGNEDVSSTDTSFRSVAPLESYEHVIVPDSDALRRQQALMRYLAPRGCWPTVSVVCMGEEGTAKGSACGRKATNELEQALEELIVMYDVHLATHGSRERWQFWQRVARDTSARRRALCKVDIRVPHAPARVVVLVDTRRDGILATKAKQLMAALGPEWGFVMIYGEENEQYARSALDDLGSVKFLPLKGVIKASLPGSDEHMIDDLSPRTGEAYNRMWKSSEFWSALGPNVNDVLTWQSDVFLTGVDLSPGLLRYDYVGAPWCNDGRNTGYMRPEDRPDWDVKMLHHTRRIPPHVRVGNGGFSLRRVAVMKALAATHGARSPVTENEDVFYVLSLDEEGRYKWATADIQEAARFSVEDLCDDMAITATWQNGQIPPPSAVVPFGVHKPLTSLSAYVNTVMKTRSEDVLEVFDRLVLAAERGQSDGWQTPDG